MGRFATREELLAVTDSSGNKHRPNSVAVSLEEMIEGRSIAEKTANMLTRADSRLTVGEFLLFRRLARPAADLLLGFFVMVAFLAPASDSCSASSLAFVGFAVPAIVISFKGEDATSRSSSINWATRSR